MSTIASAKTLDDAVGTATVDMFRFLSERLNLDKNTLEMIMSAVGNTEICQIVDPLKTAIFVMPKWILAKYNFIL